MRGVVRRIGLRHVMTDLTALCTDTGLADQPLRIDWETTVTWVRKPTP